MDFFHRLRPSQRHDSGDDLIALSVQPKTNTDSNPHGPVNNLSSANDDFSPQLSPVSASRHQFTGWKVGATSAAFIGVGTLAVNVAALHWLRNHPGEHANLVELYRGDCHRVERLQIWSHFAINALSTLLLSGSNYCMQVLCSPTRPELDRAHAKRRYLDIGVQSLRNLWAISPYRTAVWWILGLSSIPLHLMYNSAFYSSIGISDYRMNVVTPSFGDGEPFNVTRDVFQASLGDECATNATCISAVQDMLESMQTSPNVERLEPEACVAAYANTLLTERSNLVLVTSNQTNGTSPLLGDYYYWFGAAIVLKQATYRPFDWMCYSSDRMEAEFNQPVRYDSPPCDSWVSEVLAAPEKWTPYDFDIDHCLSERIEERCSFNGNVSILIVVIVFNVIKILCMLWVAFGLGNNPPLITVGDAIASYLRNPDPVTKGYCMWGRDDFVRAIKHSSPSDVGFIQPPSTKNTNNTAAAATTTTIPTAKSPTTTPHRWSQGATRQRWIWTILLLTLALIIVLSLFGAGYAAIKAHATPLSALGFGKINAAALVNGWGIVFMDNTDQQIATAIIVANLPQTILSFLYLQLNSLVTSLALTSETLSYAAATAHGTERKPLRVSLPQTATPQRSTYFLQLPYHLTFPLIALAGVLHWLVSQSFFLAVVAEYTWDGQLFDATAIATCGFSLVPMMAVLSLGVGILIALTVAGWWGRWNASGMPLAGSCSLAISALCHPLAGEDGEGVELKGVRWGVVSNGGGLVAGAGADVGHCAFTAAEVGDVVEDKLYA